MTYSTYHNPAEKKNSVYQLHSNNIHKLYNTIRMSNRYNYALFIWAIYRDQKQMNDIRKWCRREWFLCICHWQCHKI